MSQHLDTIVLFTQDFPFDTGYPTAESYLLNEIKVLSNNAKRVVIFAHQENDEPFPLLKGLPDNIEAYGVQEQKEIPSSYWIQRLQRLSHSLIPRGEMRSEKRRIDSREKRYAAASFLQVSNAKMKAISKILAEKNITLRGDKTLLYSFWFVEIARDAILLADEIERLSGTRPFCISRAHGYDCYDYRSEFDYLPFKTWMAKRLDGVYVCSSNGADYLRRKNPTVADKFHVGYLGTVDRGRASWSKREDFSIVCCSRAVPLKRVDRVLDALKILEDRGRDKLKFTFIGTGETLPVLREKAKNLTTTKVIFTGALANDKVLEYYLNNQVDIFVNVSEAEGVPLSIMEAQSCGIPVIATDVGGNSEIVQDGVCGRLIKPEFSIEELADMIEFFLVLEERKVHAYRTNARRLWKKKFDVNRNAQEMLDDVCMT